MMSWDMGGIVDGSFGGSNVEQVEHAVNGASDTGNKDGPFQAAVVIVNGVDIGRLGTPNVSIPQGTISEGIGWMFVKVAK